MSGPQPAWIEDYRSLTSGAGLVDLGNRTLIEITGADRASFLHNFCTNEVRKLAPGAGCEAFLTSLQGRTLAHVLVFAGPESLTLETVGGQAEKIIQHLDRYIIRERVVLKDISREWGEFYLAGAKAEALLTERLGTAPPQELMASIEASHKPGDVTVLIRRVDWTNSPGFLISCERRSLGAIRELFLQAGARACDPQALEAARIEAGTPQFGQDISDKNLPQEVGRDARAISFTKGCYLGQETVARLDALGHVNKMLRGVQFDGDTVPPPGTELQSDGVKVGEVTSAAFSPVLNRPLALAYVRSGKDDPGAALESPLGPARIVHLPLTSGLAP